MSEISPENPVPNLLPSGAEQQPVINEESPDPATSSAPARSVGRRNRAPDLARGVEIIRGHLKTLPQAAGVYRMMAGDGTVLYVGKAKNLRRRVTNYTQVTKLPVRLQRMVSETETMEFVTTHTEVEALLLESNLIKRLMPRYNVLLRDDKTFPHIMITRDHDYPQLSKHRGSRGREADFYGPFASTWAVNRTITALQRAFLLRNCADTVFATRTRPCLQFQIKRCTAPCVGRVSPEQYQAQVDQARAFLSGKSRDIQDEMVQAMLAASEALDFEAAARFRDRVRALTAIQAHQDINLEGVLEDVDVIAAHSEGGSTCVQVFFFRGGRNYGNRAYFPSHDKTALVEDVLAAFIAQFYENKAAPGLVLLSHDVPEQELLTQALTLRSEHKVELAVPRRGDKRRVMDHAVTNARDALGRKNAESSSQIRHLDGVASLFGLDGPLQRVEVYDNSHIQGAHAIGAMIVAGPEGFIKNAYRKFNIRTEGAAGDDFAMMREVMNRRFARAIKEDPERTQGTWPDLVLIDGGIGQLNVALEVLAELGIDDVPLVGIAKGPDRDAGRENFFLPGRAPFQLEMRDPVLYFLQRLRDEAHRFAIGTHRAKRTKALGRSQIDEIPGIGPNRKKALLLHFGSAAAVARAGLSDLESVEGISRTVAKKIYEHFNSDG